MPRVFNGNVNHDFSACIVFGTDAVRLYNAAGCVTEAVTDAGFYEHFTFATNEELKAFMMGIEAASGWLDYEVVQSDSEDADAA